MPQTKAAPKKVEHSHLKVAKKLGTDIVTGKRAPGTLLPGEIELSEEWGVSRSVIREALRKLSAKGLIESKRKAGTRVQKRDFWSILDPELLGWMFDSVPSPEFVQNLFELRMIIEPAAAEIAARKRTAQQLSTMGHAIEVMADKTLNTTAGQEADQQFHATILDASDNLLLINLSATIGAAVRWTTFFKARSPNKMRDPIQEHRDLYRAIADGNAHGAREAAIALIQLAEKDTQTVLNASPN